MCAEGFSSLTMLALSRLHEFAGRLIRQGTTADAPPVHRLVSSVLSCGSVHRVFRWRLSVFPWLLFIGQWTLVVWDARYVLLVADIYSYAGGILNRWPVVPCMHLLVYFVTFTENDDRFAARGCNSFGIPCLQFPHFDACCEICNVLALLYLLTLF